MRITGYPSLVESLTAVRFVKGRGWETTRRWTGVYTQCKSLAGVLAAQGAVQVECPDPGDKVVGYVQAVFGGTDDATPPENRVESTWELDETDADKSTWQHPRMVSLFGAYSLEQFIKIKSATDKVIRGDAYTELDADEYELVLLILASGQATDFNTFCRGQMQHDLQDTYYDPASVLRHTLTGPQGWQYTFNWDQVACLTSSAEIQASEPSLWFDLPPSRWWLTRKPRLTQRSNGTLDVTREWHEVEYDTWKYNLLSSIPVT